MGFPRKSIFSFDDAQNNFFLDATQFKNNYVAFIVQCVAYFISPYINVLEAQHYQKHIDSNKLQEIFMKGYNPSSLLSDFVAALYDTLHGDYPQPKLTIIHDGMPHYPFVRAENGQLLRKGNSTKPLDYYPQHVWSAKVLLDVIDMILEVDPDAVIVIQADHGLHGNTEKDFKAAFGDEADKKELWNCVMSAIRVPEKFRTGEEHYAMETPLNLTRYLVNSFVGRNYKYVRSSE